MTIFKLTQYVNDEGKVVLFKESLGEGVVQTVYEGRGGWQVMMKDPGLPDQAPPMPQNIPVVFEIEAESVVDAYDKYEEAFLAKIEEMKKEMQATSAEQKSKIIQVPGGMLSQIEKMKP